MGRPPKSASEKRQQVNIRLLPADKDMLQQIATDTSRPLSSVAEGIIADHLARLRITSPETRELTALVEQKIGELEVSAKGKWWKNLTPWAAVSEMLAHVVDGRRPEHYTDDEAVTEARSDKLDAERTRGQIVRKLADLGVAVNRDPRPIGLLGALRFGMFGTKSNRSSSREWELASIKAIPDQLLAHRALDTFEKLMEADSAVEAANAKLQSAIEPFLEAEQDGRRLGRRSVVQSSAVAQFLGIDPENPSWPYASRV